MTKTLYVRPEHKDATHKSKKFEQKTGLYTGVSAVALMLGAIGGSAFGAGTTVTKPATTFVVGTKQQFDFVDIEAPILNNVVNNGTIGPGASPSLIIDGFNGGSVGGDIINNGLISGTKAGIVVASTAKNTDIVGGGIFNFGTIEAIRFASKTTKQVSSAFGIVVSGPAVATSVSNTGAISASLFATGTGHTAGGVKISSSGSLSSNVTNSGAINGFGVAFPGLITGDAQMLAFGVAQTNTTAATGPATSNTLTNSPGGGISGIALAFASGTGAATATGIGVGQIGFGTSAAANVMSVSNATSAMILGFASAFAVNSTANANALGVGQSAVGGLSITQNVNNSGVINATANASVSATAIGFNTANAMATGIVQTASGSPTITQTITNSGVVNVKASASAGAVTTGLSVNANASSATALGLGQFASGGTGTVSNTLSIVNSSQGSINVTASAFGSGSTSPDALAFATGIDQSSSGGGSHSLTFTNQGALNVLADASAFGTINATATANGAAVRQTVAATAAATNISLGITNAAFANGTTTFTGSINVTASASATGPSAYAAAGAATNQPAFFQSVGGAPAGSTVNIDLTNQGNIDLNFFASATGTNAFAEVGPNRRVSAYWQDVSGMGDTVSASISNATGAVFSLNGTAFASGPGNPSATVSIVGGWQSIHGAMNVSANFSNNGTLNVGALATAQGASPFARAEVDSGFYQAVTATGGAGSNATATMTNTSFLSLNLNATANATGSTFANASAGIGFGLEQYAGGESASASLNNSGAINMNASANAVLTPTGTGNASAFATIDTAFTQTARGLGGDLLNATVDLTNSGNITLSAFASASATNDATATAELGNGIYQNADSADVVSATFINTATGNFNVNLTATAKGTDVFAKASNATNIIGQFVTAGSDDVSATASILNDGDISVVMNAIAMGTNGTGGPGASANASVELSYAFQQSVFDGANTTVSLINNGSIVFDLRALASNAMDASAIFNTFDTVFYMSASANGGTDDTVTGIFTNTGLIDVNLNATANGVTDADATAELNYFLLESIQDASVSLFNVTNSATGVISVDLVANASAPGGDASANASMTSFMEISAYASAGNQENATVNIVNNGIISVNLTANATASDTAFAAASLNYGFYHFASRGDDSTLTFTNTNSITFDLNAFASGTDASASADFSYPFYFEADASDDRNTATVTFTNSATGTILVDLSAHARGTNGTGLIGATADASASISSAVSIFAFDAQTATNTFTNDGSLTFSVGAIASNAVDASASAEIGYGINQSATATGGAGSTATATINNTSLLSLNFLITAQAFGSTVADASAEFDDTIIEQDANNAQFAEATINNSGAFKVLAQATAVASNGSAFAAASIDYGISQEASANSSAGSIATVNFTNTATGIIDFRAIAVASAFGTNTTNDLASAHATVDEFLFQSAQDGDTVSVNFTNDGTINLLAQASALGQDADASATVGSTIFDQDASNTGSGEVSASAVFVNTGDIDIAAIANAVGTNGTGGPGLTVDAFASVSKIMDQEVDDSDAVLASFTNSATGTIDIMAVAMASNGTDASASASLDGGWAQTATGFNSPNSLTSDVIFDNDGTINVFLMAKATGTNTADAYVEFDNTLIYQSASGAGDAEAVFDNSGTFTIWGQASALALTGDASATVEFDDGISQFAFANDGNEMTGVATFNNSGTFSITGIARATGATSAIADVSFSDTVISQVATGENATATFDNSGTFNITLWAFASAVSGSASASASLTTDFFEQSASAGVLAGSVATANFANSGTFNIDIMATAIAFSSASANAEISEELIEQDASGETATVNFSNSGVFTVNITAAAQDLSGDADASASFGHDVFQQDATATPNVFGTAGAATANFTNTASGTISLVVSASAVGSTFASADATIGETIIDQNANGHTAAVNITNDGTFNATIAAFASANNGSAFANASLDQAIQQTAIRSTTTTVPGGSSTATFTNTSSNSFDISLLATALGVTSASATASVTKTLIFQGAFNNETATNLINNSGAINAIVDASAIAAGNGTTGSASALARIDTGIRQSASASGGTAQSASNTYNNLGLVSSNTPSLSLQAKARAVGTTNAIANAWVSTAVWQTASGGGTLSNTFNNNTGSVLFMADADAVGGTNAFASAWATKVWQTVNPTTAGVDSTNTFQNRNSASFVVDANAVAKVSGTGAVARANATARGLSQSNTGSANEPVFNAVFFNGEEDNFKGEPDSLFLVQAFASAIGGTVTNSANAVATGYHVQSNTNSHAVLDVTNNSNFRVEATAIGATAAATAFGMIFDGGEVSGSINNAGNINVRASAQTGSAFAAGVQFNSAINNSTFTNTGTINVLAIGSTTGIAVQYNFLGGHTVTATSLDHASFINDGGTIWAQVNSSGTLGFGTAFDASNAPNPVTLALQGSNKQGTVWGNILLSDDDNILVTNGMTYYAGMINGTATFNGFLTISSGGTLTLASTATGPATGYVDTFTNTATGTLAFNVTPSTPTTGLGQINALTANLAGTVQLNIVPGLYANTQTYQDVVVASTINGNFTNTSINTNTPLLSLSAIKPGDGTIDLALTRNSFASPPGLTINQMSAGLGLDGGYSTALTGAFGSMVSNLFTLTTNAYIGALEQLHGAEHVQNLRTNLWSLNLLNYALDERINAGTFSNDGTNSRDSIIRRGETTFWGSFQGTDGDLEGDVEASGYDINQAGFFAGFDHSISKDLLVGFAAGFYRSRLNFENGTDKDDEGVQLALYGAFDTQDFYLRGNVALGYYNADVNRPINLPNQVGIARGDYNVNVLSIHGEGGKRFALDDNIFFTPFLGLNYVTAKMKSFSETGTTGANLAFPDNKVKSFTGDIGARLAASFESGSKSVIVPEVSVRYRHEFKDEILSINTMFSGIPGSGFGVISSRVDSGEFIAQGGVSFSQGDKLEIRLMYTGRFNSQIEEHGIGIRLSLLLGGRK